MTASDGMLVADETPEIREARERWDAAWKECADLKKRFFPEYAPKEQWEPLASRCEEFFQVWREKVAAWRGGR